MVFGARIAGNGECVFCVGMCKLQCGQAEKTGKGGGKRSPIEFSGVLLGAVCRIMVFVCICILLFRTYYLGIPMKSDRGRAGQGNVSMVCETIGASFSMSDYPYYLYMFI